VPNAGPPMSDEQRERPKCRNCGHYMAAWKVVSHDIARNLYLLRWRCPKCGGEVTTERLDPPRSEPRG
jgi:ribosomal protein S27AE